LVKPSLKINLTTNRVIPEKLPDIFNGSQLVVVGRYPRGGRATLTLDGQEGQERLVTSYQATLADGPTDNGQRIAQLWAQRRIGQIIEEIDQKGDGQPNEELVNELVELSKEFGIMTPYTSFLAMEGEPLTDVASQRARATQNLTQLEETTGASANWQRSKKSEMLAASAAPSSTPKPKAVADIELKTMASLEPSLDSSRLVPPTIIDGQAFFQKNGQLIQGTMSEEDLKNLQVIKKFSPAYFDLAKKLAPSQMAFLTRPEPLAFTFEGQNYLIDIE
jgi:Ca-activated chloride channel family protein